MTEGASLKVVRMVFSKLVQTIGSYRNSFGLYITEELVGRKRIKSFLPCPDENHRITPRPVPHVLSDLGKASLSPRAPRLGRVSLHPPEEPPLATEGA